MTDRNKLGTIRRKWAAVTLSLAIMAMLFILCNADGLQRSWGATAGESKPAATAETTGSGVRALARLEPASGVVLIGARPGQRVVEILVTAGQPVSKAQLIATMEGRDTAIAQLAVARASKKVADWKRSLKSQALAVERDLTDQTRKAQLDSATKASALTKQKFSQASLLFKEFGGTLKGKERYDAESALLQLEMLAMKTELEYTTLRAVAAADVKKRAVEDLEFEEKSPESDLLDAQIKLAESAVSDTEIRAASNGKVLRVLAHAGEASSGALAEIGDVSQMVATAEVYESDVPRVHVGDSAAVKIFDQEIPGKVSKVGTIVGKNQMTSLDPRALRDLRVIMVTIELDDDTLAAPFVNMEVEASISPGTSSTSK